MIVNQGKLVANPCVACDNHYNGGIVIIIANLIKNNFFHNHIFIYYRNNINFVVLK